MTSTNSSPDKLRTAVGDFLESMTAVFKTPYNLKGERVAVALQNYSEVLEKYDDATLAELWLRSRVKFSGQWPSIKDLAETAGEICGEVAVKETRDVNIEKALASPQGQHALENGSAVAFLAACKNLGWVVGQTLTERIVRQNRQHCEGLDEHWLKAHQETERELREQYLTAGVG